MVILEQGFSDGCGHQNTGGLYVTNSGSWFPQFIGDSDPLCNTGLRGWGYYPGSREAGFIKMEYVSK